MAKKNDKAGMVWGDIPLWLYKEFMRDINREYNGTYWVKLLDLMRKAEAYDFLLANGAVPLVPSTKDEPKEEESSGEVVTFGRKLNR